MTALDFLPPELTDPGDWASFVAQLYPLFHDKFIASAPLHCGTKVEVTLKPGDEGKAQGFWHLVTRENTGTGIREPDVDRAIRLPWILKPSLISYSLQVLNKKNGPFARSESSFCPGHRLNMLLVYLVNGDG